MGKLKSAVARHYLGATRKNKLRRKFEARRQKSGAPHIVSYFHQVDDPYSHLIAQILKKFAGRYNIELNCHLVPPPSAGAAPEPEMLKSFGRRDAALIARRYGLEFMDIGDQPPDAHISAAQNALTLALSDGTFIENAPKIGKRLWTGELLAEPLSDFASRSMTEGADLRQKHGHYSGGMIHYGGEWYWGIDRLHYLENRLTDLGALSHEAPSEYLCPVPELLSGGGQSGAEIEFFASLRSPYTMLAAERVFDLARAYGATVKIRPVLPMVLRGLPVPTSKRLYIVRDVKRQADHQGIPFGHIADPLGKPVERGIAILVWAFDQGKGEAFLRSFLTGVFAEGTDAGTDRGLRKIVERAGLDWRKARARLIDERWRASVNRNREDMMKLGLWGVPSFRIGTFSTWGEDRLWQVEDVLKAMSK